MRRLALVLAILALCAIAGADALRSQIDATTAAVHAAIMNRDIDAYAKAVKDCVTKDFKCTEKGKTGSIDLLVAEMKQVFDAIPQTTSEEAILLSLVKKSYSATGTTEHKIKGVSTDENGDTHKVAFYGTSVETYRKVKGKWLVSKIAWRTRQMTMDGKPMDMTKTPAADGS